MILRDIVNKNFIKSRKNEFSIQNFKTNITKQKQQLSLPPSETPLRLRGCLVLRDNFTCLESTISKAKYKIFNQSQIGIWLYTCKF